MTLKLVHPVAAEAATELGAKADEYAASSGQLAVVLMLCSASLVAVLLVAALAALV